MLIEIHAANLKLIVVFSSSSFEVHLLHTEYDAELPISYGNKLDRNTHRAAG